MHKKVTLYAKPDIKTEIGFIWCVVDNDLYHMTMNDEIKIQEIEIYIPDLELSEQILREKAIKTYKEKQEGIRASAHRAIQALEWRIERLQLLEHKPEVVE